MIGHHLNQCGNILTEFAIDLFNIFFETIGVTSKKWSEIGVTMMFIDKVKEAIYRYPR